MLRAILAALLGLATVVSAQAPAADVPPMPSTFPKPLRTLCLKLKKIVAAIDEW